MKLEQFDCEPALSADFAHRVVTRVRKLKRQRRIRRALLASAAACAVLLVALFFVPALRPAPPATIATRAFAPAPADAGPAAAIVGYPGEFDRMSDSSTVAISDPLAFFFPGAVAVADFQSAEAASWHSYDPWWNSSQ